MSEASIKIAISPCPNDIFIFGHLIEKNVEWDGPKLKFDYLDIQALNEAILDESSPYDLIKCSYAIYPKIQSRYELFSIGAALGSGVGPLLVGQPGLSLDQRKKVYVPGFDTTANQLFKLYGPKNIKTEELRYDLLLDELTRDETVMGVIVHESRFTYEDLGLELLLDLGQAWEQKTNLPLPLGGPMILKSCSDEMKKALSKVVKQSLEKAWENRKPIEKLLTYHAQEMSLDVMSSHIDLYVNDYSLDLGDSGLMAIHKLVGLK